MLNLAADEAASPAEKEQAMRRVTKLMDEHNLREEDLADADGILDSLDNIEVGHAKVDLGIKACAWMSALCVWTERLLGTVKTYVIRSGKQTNCVFYGVLSDCQIAAEIYFEARDFIETACGTKYGGCKRGDGYSYCMGFITGLQEQLKRAQTVNAPMKNALVVKRNAIVVKKQALAERWKQDQNLKLCSRSQRVHIRNDVAFLNGIIDGSRYSVNTDRRKKLTT